jgi:prepilin-type N-terminal cleavage/methylation domain-containing protein
MGQMKKTSKKGFTVAELLIVVGIIAVLVAIAIPVYRHKAEKAKEAYDIHTMRQAASAAIDLYYMGVDELEPGGLKWWNKGNTNKNRINAAGAYDPSTGKFVAERKDLPGLGKNYTGYGKGTNIDGKTSFFWGNSNRKAYDSTANYTEAVVMVSIFPYADVPRVDVYWKTNKESGSSYVGGGANDEPYVSIRIYLN